MHEEISEKRQAAPPLPPQSAELFAHPGYLLFIVVAAIFLSELFIMFILDKILPFFPHHQGFVDACLLVSISFPMLYLLVFRPMRLHISRRWRAEMEKDAVITDLQAALSEVKTLRGIIPICASCKKIRDDKGYWNAVEVYISNHSEAMFTHGICPECTIKLHAEVRDYFEGKGERPPAEA